MVRALTQRWRALKDHRQGRFLALLLEVAWIVGWTLAVWRLWDTPQAWFAYLHV